MNLCSERKGNIVYAIEEERRERHVKMIAHINGEGKGGLEKNGKKFTRP